MMNGSNRQILLCRLISVRDGLISAAFATTANSNESGKTVDGTTTLMLTANSAVAGL